MKKLRITFQKTKFKEVEMIAVSAKPGGPDASSEPYEMTQLVEKLMVMDQVYLPDRVPPPPQCLEGQVTGISQSSPGFEGQITIDIYNKTCICVCQLPLHYKIE